MSSRERLGLWFLVSVLPLAALTGACVAYIRLGTDPIAIYESPDGKWEALLMVKNPGAMGGFSTQVSLVSATIPFAEQVALYRAGNVFIADDDHGAVPSDSRGGIDVNVVWKSRTELDVSYPARARVFEQVGRTGGITIQYSLRK